MDLWRQFSVKPLQDMAYIKCKPTVLGSIFKWSYLFIWIRFSNITFKKTQSFLQGNLYENVNSEATSIYSGPQCINLRKMISSAITIHPASAIDFTLWYWHGVSHSYPAMQACTEFGRYKYIALVIQYTPYISRYNVTRYCTQHNNFENFEHNENKTSATLWTHERHPWTDTYLLKFSAI